jgi:heat-inducible transcriptional repressor
MEDIVSQRAQFLLRLLVERYIRDGQPVSSKSLAEEHALPLSPATIRNVMADLEERGFIKSLHTSSGRIPTTQGYRLFVNSLLTAKPVNQLNYQDIKQEINPDQNVADLVATTSSLLSRLTQMTGLVTLPKLEKITLRHVEFLPLSNKRVLVILVLNEKEVQNRIIQTEREFSRSELENAANFLNQTFVGKDLQSVRQALLTELKNDRLAMDNLMRSTLEAATSMFEHTKEESYVVAGEHHLLGLADETNIHQLRQLFSAFTEKREILYLLDQTATTDGIQIFIGDESGYEIFDKCSVVTSPYHDGEKVVGALAVIGPTRMQYDRVIPIVDISAKLLSAALRGEKN